MSQGRWLITSLLALCLLSYVRAEIRIVKVTFPDDNNLDDFTFEGSLYLPSTDVDGPVPGVVLIHRSGPNSRHVPMNGQNAVFWDTPVPIFREIATALAEQGIAVLTYDKRSCSRYNNCYDNSYPFSGPFDYSTINVFLNDASTAARFLQNYDNVNSEAVVVAGHSQSGQFLPSMLVDNPTLLGGIMLAAPFRPIDEILEYQVQFSLELFANLYGFHLEEAMQYYPDLKTLIELRDGVGNVASGRMNVTRGEESGVLVGGIPISFWNSWIDLADKALENAAKISQPLLLINGDMDSNNPVSETDMWAAYLDDIGASDRYQKKIFRCLTHAFNCIDAPDFSAPIDESAISLIVDPRLPETMAAWIKQLVVATGAQEDSGSTPVPTTESSSANRKTDFCRVLFTLVMWTVYFGATLAS
ncbi:serine aminopeptidase, S33 [Nitzschia inconspicua]|uniref:Serine aminopeptidase, S33 n=1 Tax=Nitzschia inconspicua TaxID=303405 RepID=A0A9K3L439_9STRA|nr:serine aminopeptidase, S33 [Nitzschia inconspicua]